MPEPGDYPVEVVQEDEEEVSSEPVIQGPPAPPKVAESVLQPLLFRPALNYGAHLLKDTATLHRAFLIMHAAEQYDQMYFLGERLLEHKGIDETTKKQVASKMGDWVGFLKPWVYDEHETESITLTISGIAGEEGYREELEATLEELIEASSGSQVIGVVKFKEGMPSLRVTFPHHEAFVGLRDVMDLKVVISDLYLLLATEMNQTEEITLPAWESVEAEEFKSVLTRYAWQQLFARESHE